MQKLSAATAFSVYLLTARAELTGVISRRGHLQEGQLAIEAGLWDGPVTRQPQKTQGLAGEGRDSSTPVSSTSFCLSG